VSAEAVRDAVGDPDIAARIAVKVSAKARRISLRVDPGTGQVILVQPTRAPTRDVLAFMSSRRDWIAARLKALPRHVAFIDGATLPLGGVPHVVRYVPEQRGGVWRDGDAIFVTGRAEHGARRLRDWLKAHAKTIISPAARAMAETMGRKVAYVGIRDTRSRWGSCTHTGRLSFSWRLVLAPEHVLTYVIAHEVAHLKHMHHGPAFWRLVESLLAGSGVDVASARDWLRTHGAALHRYG
jgi:predicted metal-dependent hydrolase